MSSISASTRRGEVLRFKSYSDQVTYGATATVEAVSWSIDRPHPGPVTHKWIDLVTLNGTRLQWPPATVNAAFRRETA